MFNTDKIYFHSSRHYNSVSNIEKLNSSSSYIDLPDLGYDYSLNLQTKSKLSNTFNIFLTEQELKELIIDPIEELIRRRKQILVDPICVSTSNIISSKLYSIYSLNTLLSDSLFSVSKSKQFGCMEYLNIRYIIEDHRFITMKFKAKYRWFLFRYAPQAIQPSNIRLSIEDAEILVENLAMLIS